MTTTHDTDPNAPFTRTERGVEPSRGDNAAGPADVAGADADAIDHHPVTGPGDLVGPTPDPACSAIRCP